MEPVENESVEQTIALFRELMGKIAAKADPAWMEEAQLTLPQLKTAMILRQQGDWSVGRVAERLKVGEPTASHLVDRLVQSGLAERTEDEKDRRRTLVRLSPTGRKLVEERLQRTEEHLRELFARISQEELTALRQGLHAIVEAARNER